MRANDRLLILLLIMARSNKAEEDSTGFLEKGDEGDSDIGYEYDPPKPYSQRQLQWLNIARSTAHWTGHLTLVFLLILIFRQSTLFCPALPDEKRLIRSDEGTMASRNVSCTY